MKNLQEEIIQKLHDFLLEKESFPIKDAAKIMLPDGVNAAAIVQTIKECINIVKRCYNEAGK